jgi:hypothetical protein
MSEIKFSTPSILAWTKKNKKTLEDLYQPSVENVVELIKLGGVAKNDIEAAAFLDDRIENGYSLPEVAGEFMLASANYSSYGPLAVEQMVSVLTVEVERRIAKVLHTLKKEDEVGASEGVGEVL